MPEFLNRWRTSLVEFWARLENGQRIRLVTGIVLGLALLFAFILFVTAPKYAVLYENLSHADAGKVVEELKAEKVKYKLEGTTIMVPEEKVNELQANLVYNNIVSDEAKIPEMSAPSIMETETDKQNRIKQYTEAKIISGLKSIDGIEDVSLNLNLPEETNFIRPDEQVASAGVIVKMASGAPPLDKKQVYGIVRFVALSSGLKPDQVSVLDENANELNNSDSTSGYVNTQMELQDSIKTEIQKSVLKFLEAPFGSSNVKVLAAVKLNFNDEVQESTTYTPINEETQSGILRSANEINKELANGTTSGVPGTSSNTPTDTTTYPEGSGSSDKYIETSKTLNYEINETMQKIVKEKGNIQQLSMSIILNKASLPEGANAEELTKSTIQLVGYALKGYLTNKAYTDDQLKELVSISIMDFDSSAQKAAETKAAETKRQDLIRLIITIVSVVLGVAVFGAALFFFIRGRMPRAEEGLAMAGGAGETITVTGTDGKVYNIPKRPDIEVPEIDVDDHNELRKQLEKFVGTKPDAVAQLLKSWINDD